MFYIISFGEKEYLDYRYKSKSNIVVISHCFYQAKSWKTKLGVYRAAKHLPKAFQDFVVIHQVDYNSYQGLFDSCRWNLSAFKTYEIQEDL